jgi:glutathione S-transferase
MSGITVYGIPGSPLLRSVEVTLKEKGVDYRLHVVPPTELKEAEHLERHAFGRIPVFEHGDFRLYETQAIIRYLDRSLPEPQLSPASPKALARMDQIIGIIECYFFPKAAAPIVGERIVRPALFGLPTDEARIAEAIPMARTCFAEFDRLLGDKTYLTGDEVTIADIMLAAQLDLLAETPEGGELMAGTRLESWLERMLARPSFVATQPPELLRRAA